MTFDRITIRLTPDLVEALERYTAAEQHPTRQDAFRHIIRDWFIGNGYLSSVSATPGGRYRQMPRPPLPSHPAVECRAGDSVVLRCRVAALVAGRRAAVEIPGLAPRVTVQISADIAFEKGAGQAASVEVGDSLLLCCAVIHAAGGGRIAVRIPGMAAPMLIRMPDDAVVLRHSAPEE